MEKELTEELYEAWECLGEKRPEIQDCVLTYWSSGKYQVLQYCGGYDKEKNKTSWLSTNGKIENIYHTSNLFECITHWVKLLEPPEILNKRLEGGE